MSDVAYSTAYAITKRIKKQHKFWRKENMKKRILSVLIAVVMLIGMLPTAVFAAETTYDIWVGGVQVTSDAVFEEKKLFHG